LRLPRPSPALVIPSSPPTFVAGTHLTISQTRYALRYAGSWGSTCLQGLREPPGSCKLLKNLALGLWQRRDRSGSYPAMSSILCKRSCWRCQLVSFSLCLRPLGVPWLQYSTASRDVSRRVLVWKTLQITELLNQLRGAVGAVANELLMVVIPGKCRNSCRHPGTAF
jgi:hypothetical protein